MAASKLQRIIPVLSALSHSKKVLPKLLFTLMQLQYQNSGCRSYEVTLKAEGRGYGRSGVTGSAGAYNVGARTWPQLIGCALAQEPGVLNFRLGLQTMEGDEYAETGR